MRTNPVVMMFAAFVAVIAGTIQPVGSVPVAAAETEKPMDIIATQIRKQGYKCDKPQSAERDRAASKPDQAVWVLHCVGATYRVRLHPDMAAQVERLN